MKKYTHTDCEYERVRNFIESRSGILIPEEKRYLIDHRLAPLLLKYSYNNFEELISNAHNNTTYDIANAIIDAITIHESQWFRDRSPFELLSKIILPDLCEKIRSKERNRIRILSAGSAKGQEAFSIMMTIDQFCNLSSNASSKLFEILAIDISQEVLSKAKSAQFTEFEMERGLPASIRDVYFYQEDQKWILKQQYLNRVEFKYWNLLNPMDSLGMFDVIFLRNVLIYFADWAKQKSIENAIKILRKNGKLFLGSMETLMGNEKCLERKKLLNSVFYEKCN